MNWSKTLKKNKTHSTKTKSKSTKRPRLREHANREWKEDVINYKKKETDGNQQI